MKRLRSCSRICRLCASVRVEGCPQDGSNRSSSTPASVRPTRLHRSLHFEFPESKSTSQSHTAHSSFPACKGCQSSQGSSHLPSQRLVPASASGNSPGQIQAAPTEIQDGSHQRHQNQMVNSFQANLHSMARYGQPFSLRALVSFGEGKKDQEDCLDPRHQQQHISGVMWRLKTEASSCYMWHQP